MVWKRQVLVLANVTATSGELLAALSRRAERGPVAYTLLIPATRLGGGRSAAAQQLNEALERLREGGLEADGIVGDGDAMVAVAEAWDPKRYDEIILSTLPTNVSKWLHADLPRRIQRHTGALVTHVVAQPPKPGPTPTMVPVRESGKSGVLTPLSSLTWGSRPERRVGDRP